MPNPRPAPLLALVAFAITALSILPLASAQNAGNFVAGLNFSAGYPAYATNTGYYLGGIAPEQVASGDFNGDGKTDIIVAGSCSYGTVPGCTSSGSIIALYLGNGDSTLQSPILSGTELPPDLRSVVVGDFNHDGNLDVAVASDCLSSQDCSSGTVTILLGNGKGSFSQSSQYPINGIVSQANTLAVGQFTTGENLDLVVGIACYNISVTGCTYGSVAVYPGDGAGKLGTPTNYQTVGNQALYPVVADFNGDGHLDIIAVSMYSSTGTTSNSTLTLLVGSGPGTFASPVVTAIPYSPTPQVVAADFNHDGKQDLAILSSYGSTQIFLGKGNGAFQTPVAYQSGGSYSLAVSDLNGDGRPDLLVAGAAGSSNNVTPLLNNGTGIFTVETTYPLGGWGDSFVTSGDFNGDGKQDIVLASFCSETSMLNDHCPDGTLSVLLGNGNGAMQGAVPANLTLHPHHQLLVDMNGDGILDMVGTEDCYQGSCSSLGGVAVALGIGDGQFAPAMAFPVPYVYPTGIAVGDLNGDGHPDIVIDGYENSSSTNSVAVLLGSPDGSLASAKTYSVPDETLGPPAIADFAGNNKLGVAVVQLSSGNSPNGVAVLPGNGDGTLQAEKFTALSEIYPYQVVAGDFNKDGKADIAAFGTVTTSGFPNVGAVSVFLGKGDGTLTVKPDPDNNPVDNPLYACDSQNLCVFLASYPSFGVVGATIGWDGYSPLSLADLDGDGNPDLLIANECRTSDSACSTGELVYFHGNGDGTFNDAENNGPAQQLPDANYLGVSAADVNGDGKPDIIASTLSGVAVYLAPFTAPGTIYATSGITDAEIPAIGDINGDGAPDIAIAGGSGVVDLLFNRFPRDKSTTTTLTSSANPAAVGQPITFTATVTPASGPTPTGSVTFTHSGVDTTVPLTNGVATLTVSNLTVATGHPILAVYSGSTSDSASTSNQVTQAVLIPTTTTLTSSANPATLGQPITFTATVSATSGTTPTGNVVFSHSGSVYATVALSNGVATYATSTLTAATGHPVVATYAGAELDASSVSNQVTQAVLIPTTTALVSSANPALLSQPITFTATVTATSGATPTGNVTFSHSGTAYATVALNNGVATYTTSSLTAATGHPFLATYAGAGLDAGSVSNQVTQAVLIPTATVLSSSLNPATSGQSVTLTAKVTASSGATPTGTVTFMNGSKTLGTGTLTSGVATYTTSTLPTGTLSLTAVYAKNGVDAASTSTALKETINP